MSRTIKLTPPALETLAEHTGRPIELADGRAYLTVDGTTYWAQVVFE